MKLGILGGTFNPIHNSHLYLAERFAEHLGLDRVLFIPTYTPPHKEAAGLATAADRLEMCRLALKSHPGFDICEYEIERGGKSYTYKTLEYLKEKSPQADLYLLMGADMFLSVQEWKEPRRIYSLTYLCAAARAEEEHQKLLRHQPILEEQGARCVVMDIPPRPLSSTQIRSAIAQGRDVSDLLPPPVWEYIRARGVYEGGTTHA